MQNMAAVAVGMAETQLAELGVVLYLVLLVEVEAAATAAGMVRLVVPGVVISKAKGVQAVQVVQALPLGRMGFPAVTAVGMVVEAVVILPEAMQAVLGAQAAPLVVPVAAVAGLTLAQGAQEG